jgi:hypothetical protein
MGRGLAQEHGFDAVLGGRRGSVRAQRERDLQELRQGLAKVVGEVVPPDRRLTLERLVEAQARLRDVSRSDSKLLLGGAVRARVQAAGVEEAAGLLGTSDSFLPQGARECLQEQVIGYLGSGLDVEDLAVAQSLLITRMFDVHSEHRQRSATEMSKDAEMIDAIASSLGGMACAQEEAVYRTMSRCLVEQPDGCLSAYRTWIAKLEDLVRDSGSEGSGGRRHDFARGLQNGSLGHAPTAWQEGPERTRALVGLREEIRLRFPPSKVARASTI